MRRVHLIGIGGTGLSAIAQVLLEQGWVVSGSDRQLSPLAEAVRAAGARVEIGHRAENVQGAELVIRSSAIADDNVEVQAARAAGIPVVKRADFLGELLDDKVGVAVAGTHGKTTTTAMIAWILTALGQDPSYIIGGQALDLHGNAHSGRGPHFVIEADEYDYMFLGLHPDLAVVTNIEHDHPDCFPTPQAFAAAFSAFIERIRPGGTLLACVDDPGASHLLDQARQSGMRALAYGLDQPGLALTAVDWSPVPGEGYTFTAVLDPAQMQVSEPIVSVALQVPGLHNVRNALAALGVAAELGLPVTQAAQALRKFQGTGRRFELRGSAGGVLVFDDYAHHPTEIRATLAAARSRYPGKPVWVVWQPHTYSRTRTLLSDFLAAFDQADQVVVTQIYAAREASPEDGFSSRQVADALAKQGQVQVHPVSSLNEAAAWLLQNLPSEAVLLVLSAGDADQISRMVLDGLATKTGEDNHGKPKAHI